MQSFILKLFFFFPSLLTLTLFWGPEGEPTNPEYDELCCLHGTFPSALHFENYACLRGMPTAGSKSYLAPEKSTESSP